MDRIAAPSEPLIRVVGLCKWFDTTGGRLEILKGVDLTLASGETLAVVGASGIGKSTLLHILGTLERPDAGQVLLNGQDIFAHGNDRLARIRNRRIGFVFQFHHLLPEFSALENAMMPGLIAGEERRAAASAAEQILVRVGLKDRLGHRVGELSGGEQQRVALARALVLNPPLLLADEPTGNLDRKNSDQVHELLMSLNAEFGMTVVVVTHNPQLAAMLSRQVTIAEGRLVDES
ncbi:MAG: ABC transporter ATP-binding protein [Desulfobacterales bacterium]|nr:ABC transporter ATP-binding protein [Desulfobacterales bacterium]